MEVNVNLLMFVASLIIIKNNNPAQTRKHPARLVYTVSFTLVSEKQPQSSFFQSDLFPLMYCALGSTLLLDMVPNLICFSISRDFAEAIFHIPNSGNDYTKTKKVL